MRSKVGNDPLILMGSVVVISNKNGEILLQQRINPYGRWGLPGGLMELGESVEETAIREVYEESGLIIEQLDLLTILSGKRYYIELDNGDKFYSVTTAFHSPNPKGELKIDKDESIDFRYFNLKQLPTNLVGSHREIIEKYRTLLG